MWNGPSILLANLWEDMVESCLGWADTEVFAVYIIGSSMQIYANTDPFKYAKTQVIQRKEVVSWEKIILHQLFLRV